jgi:DNA-binding NtrC family response regulator
MANAGHSVRELARRGWAYAKRSAGGISKFGNPLILVVESDKALRKELVCALREQHYRTIEASAGAEAVRIGVRCGQKIHLLVTAAILPDLIGRELGELLRLDHPYLQVICFGHTLDYYRWRADRRISWLAFVETGFGFKSLLRAVRQRLQTPRQLNPALRLAGVT